MSLKDKVRILKTYARFPEYWGEIGTVIKKLGALYEVKMEDGRIICPFNPQCVNPQCEDLDKLAVLTTPENWKELNQFLKDHSLEYIQYKPSWSTGLNSYFYYPQREPGFHSHAIIEEGYKLVTMEEFNKILNIQYMLPKKWKIKVNDSNRQELGAWRDAGYLFRSSNGWVVSEAIGSKGYYFNEDPKGYNEITMEQFRKYVVYKKVKTYSIKKEMSQFLTAAECITGSSITTFTEGSDQEKKLTAAQVMGWFEEVEEKFIFEISGHTPTVKKGKIAFGCQEFDKKTLQVLLDMHIREEFSFKMEINDQVIDQEILKQLIKMLS